MLIYKHFITKDDISTHVYLDYMHQRINEEIYELIELNWLNGLLTRIHNVDIKQSDSDDKFHYEIEYEVFEDKNFKYLTERLQIGL